MCVCVCVCVCTLCVCLFYVCMCVRVCTCVSQIEANRLLLVRKKQELIVQQETLDQATALLLEGPLVKMEINNNSNNNNNVIDKNKKARSLAAIPSLYVLRYYCCSYCY